MLYCFQTKSLKNNGQEIKHDCKSSKNPRRCHSGGFLAHYGGLFQAVAVIPVQPFADAMYHNTCHNRDNDFGQEISHNAPPPFSWRFAAPKSYHKTFLFSTFFYKSRGTTRRTRFLPPAFAAFSSAIAFLFQ